MLIDHNVRERLTCARRSARFVVALLVAWFLICGVGQIEGVTLSSFGSQSAADHLQQARSLLRQGDHAGARDAARKVLERDAQSFEAEYLVGAAELALGRIDEAQTHFERALQIAPQHFEARRGLGAINLRRKLYGEASAEFAQALTVRPDDFVSLYSLGLSYLLGDRPAEAAEQFEKAHRVNPGEVSLLLAMLQARVKLRQRSPAEVALNELRRSVDARDPRRLQAAFLLGAEGFYDLAVREYEELNKLYPESDQLTYNLALAYHRANRGAQAAKFLEDALARREAANLFNLLGEVREVGQLYAPAAAAYRRASELEPQNEIYLFDYAQALVRAGEIDDALNVFAKAAENFPNSVRLRLGRGAAQYVKGDYEEAVRTLLKASEVDPQAPEVYELLGRAYDAAGSSQGAVEGRFSDYLKTRTGDARAEFFYGKILAARGRQTNDSETATEGRRRLEKALSLSENFAEAHFELGVLLLEKNQLAAARRHLERAAQITPNWPEVFYRLSRLYAKVGEKQRAQESLTKFRQLKARQDADESRAEMMRYLSGEGRPK